MAMTRKVLHLIDTPDLSGPGKTIVNSCRLSKGRGYEKVVAVFAGDGENTFLRYVREKGIRGYGIRERYKLLPGPLANIAVVADLRALLREEKVDILHAHGFKGDVLGSIAAIGTGIRMVTTQHGFINNTTSARVYNRLSMLVSKRMDRVIAVSEKMRYTLLDAGIAPGKTVVVHNAIVVDDYLPLVPSEMILDRCNLRGVGPVIGCIGRLSREKGHDVLCQAFISVCERHPSARLLIVGSGPEMGRLQEKYRRYSRQIIFVGHVTNVHEYISVMDLNVLPSFTEGLPNVVLETACMQVPSVATSVGGTPECIIDGVTGILVPPGDQNRLSQAILNVVGDDGLRKSLGQGARRFVLEQFSFEQRVNKVIALYDGIFDVRSVVPEMEGDILSS
jgi:glycosyltransferase involved in cell wall biosynthesis